MNNPKTKRIIKIHADSAMKDAPKDFDTRSEISIRPGDDIQIEVLLKHLSTDVNPSDIKNITLEVFDIGERNSPEPRDIKRLVHISENCSYSSADESPKHAVFNLSFKETSMMSGSKWIKICAYSQEGSRTTFLQGWIDVSQNIGEQPSNTEDAKDIFVKFDYLNDNFCKSSNNLSDLSDVQQARDNLDIYSKNESSNIHLTKSNNLSDVGNIASARTNINVYSKGEVDSKFTAASTEIESVKKHYPKTDGILFGSNAVAVLPNTGGTTTTAIGSEPPISICLTYDSPIAPTGNGYSKLFSNLGYVTINEAVYHHGIELEIETNGSLKLKLMDGSNVGYSAVRTLSALPSGKHTVIATLSNSWLNGKIGDLNVKFYIDGIEWTNAVVARVSSSLNWCLSGRDVPPININTGIFVAITNPIYGSFKNFKYSRLKVFNYVLPLNKSADTNSTRYTVEDYHNGIDEPLPMLKSTSTYRAYISLADKLDSVAWRDRTDSALHAYIVGDFQSNVYSNPAHLKEKISWAGTSTLQNINGTLAIPAKSKVTAYAVASGNLSAAFKVLGNTATNSTLTANILTEVGSWLCQSAGAFSIQPTVAYTGTVEVFLKIETLL